MKRSGKWWLSSVSVAAVLLSGGVARAGELPDTSAEVAEELQPALLAVSMNGAPAGEPVLLLKSRDGTLHAPEDALSDWRLKPWRPAFSQGGTKYYSLSVAGLDVQLEEATQTLFIRASAERLEPTRVSSYSLESGPMTPSATGGFLNYDLVAQVVQGQPSVNGLFEAGVFTRFGVGLTSFVGQWTEDKTSLTRLETNWTKDDPEKMRSLRIGDSITRGGVASNPVRFAGVQLARNFEVQPGFITIPLPSLQAEAAVPSVVDVYVNNVLTQSRDLPPGPFEIRNIPVVTGGGDVQLVVRDLLGRETLIRESYYAARQLLRRGLHDYSYEAGFLRRKFGRASFDYGSPMMSAMHRYGISDRMTGEVHLTATPDVQTAGVGASLAVADVALFNASAAASHSDLGQGTQFELGFERRTARISYGALAELISDDYVSVGTERREHRPPATTLQAYAGIPLEFGSLGLSYLWRDMRDEPSQQLLSANLSLRIGSLGTLNVAGRTSLTGGSGTAVLASVVIPLGPRTSASVGGELGETTRFTTSIQKSLPAGEGFGYRAATEVGEIDRLDGRLSYQTSFGTYDAELSWVDGRTGVRMTAAGGVGAVQGEFFASRKLTQSFATVEVGDYSGVRIYADNQHVATTDKRGRAVIPRLRPFERNVLRMDIADLPLDSEFPRNEQVVRPYARSGVAVDFDVSPSRGAIATLLRSDGTPVPTGASVRLDDQPDEFVVAPGGEVYLTGLDEKSSAVAWWEGGRCRFQVSFPTTAEPQPRLGTIHCKSLGQ